MMVPDGVCSEKVVVETGLWIDIVKERLCDAPIIISQKKCYGEHQ
jgi:hypothetical protein